MNIRGKVAPAPQKLPTDDSKLLTNALKSLTDYSLLVIDGPFKDLNNSYQVSDGKNDAGKP